MSEAQSTFNRMRRGELAPPPVLTLLGGVIREVNAEAGLLRTDYTAAPSFLNPAGGVQGGMLCAMLDDLTASLQVDMVDPFSGTGGFASWLNTTN